jgi:hypothetical protein
MYLGKAKLKSMAVDERMLQGGGGRTFLLEQQPDLLTW